MNMPENTQKKKQRTLKTTQTMILPIIIKQQFFVSLFTPDETSERNENTHIHTSKKGLKWSVKHTKTFF
jgi:hypothetical protein